MIIVVIEKIKCNTHTYVHNQISKFDVKKTPPYVRLINIKCNIITVISVNTNIVFNRNHSHVYISSFFFCR